MQIKSLFDKTRKYLDYFFDNIDIDIAQNILDKLIRCKSNIILTGVGKSGYIANKIAMTMLSTGTRALYLPAMDALHGDIGVINSSDIFVVISKSGETDELINLVPYVKKRKAEVIAIVSNENSRLSKISDLSITLPVEKELCPYNLAPTTSTAVQLIFGDILTIALMQKKDFSLQDYAKNHPAGAIGKQISLKVADLMLEGNELPICKPQDFIKDVLHELSIKRCGCLLVVNDNHNLVGIFTDGDLRRSLHKEGIDFFKKTMQDVMTKSAIVISREALAIDAMRLMEDDKLITIVPVIENMKLKGLIRMHDIIQAGLTSLLL